MKYEMDQADIDLIKFDMNNNRTLKHLKNMALYKFTIGDILVREERYLKDGTTYEWKTYLAECGLPYKYMYVFENDLGIGYIRRLSINGRKFVEHPMCVLEFDPTQTKFSLDPEYADHLLLSPDDEAFDAKTRYEEIKKKREAMHRKNKKLKISFKTPEEAVTFIQNLPIGTQFWYGYSANSVDKDSFTVVEKGKDSNHPSYARSYQLGQQQQAEADMTWFSYRRGTNNTYDYKIYATSLLKDRFNCLYLTRPLFFDELPI